MVVDKFPFDNTHRSGSLKILNGQNLIVAEGDRLPFRDKAFDYVICSHVLEHVEDPSCFLNEISRIGKRGYIEVPSLIGEYLIPKRSHRWVVLELNQRLVLMEKEDINLTPSMEFGDLLQKHLAPSSIEFNILMKTYPDLFTVRYEWADQIDFIVDPQNPELRSFFTRPWTKEKISSMFNFQKSKVKLLVSFLRGFGEVLTDFIRYRG